ncbi:MAG: cytochrome c [Pyrinomonadaceae bacterium]|nr:cytochrome c [Pyrinomonadaceae bacterium]
MNPMFEYHRSHLKIFVIALALVFCTFVIHLGERENLAAEFNPQRTGAEIYAASCRSCHAANGSGNTRRGKRKGAKDLRSSRISRKRGISIIRNGKGKMPGFKKRLTAKEITRVNNFVRGFRK